MTDILMPQLGETVREGKLLAWHKQVGETVAAGETLFDVSTDKVDTEIPAPASGVLSAIVVQAGMTVPVGTRLGAIAGRTGDAPAAPSPANGGEPPGGAAGSPGPVERGGVGAPPPRTGRRGGRWDGKKVSPLARRLLAQHGIAFAQLAVSVPGERVGRREVEAFVARRTATVPAAPRVAAVAGPDDELVPLTRVRAATAEHLAPAALVPQVTQAVEIDFAAVDKLRRANPGLSFLPFVARAVTIALGEFPYLNASFAGDSLVVHRRRHLGIAVDLDLQGLVVPVIRDAGRFTVRGLAAEIARLAARARTGQLTADDLAGGTYTITNNGSFGTLFTTPVLNPPQVAILSCDGVRSRPAVVAAGDGEALAIRPLGILAQSFDHRAVDGAYGAAFLRRLKDVIEHRDWAAELA